MKIFTLKSLLLLAGAIILLVPDISAQFAGGTGTSGNPYQVANATHLNNVRDHLGSYFIQTANIDLNVAPYNTGDGWEPIGTSSAKFTGNYNAQGYTVSNLFINRNSTDNVGLFGFTSGTAIISRLGVINVNVTGRNSVGAIAGLNEGSLSECYSTGSVEGSQNTGGLVGYNYGWGASNTGEIINCYSQAYARGTSVRSGGLTGYDYYGIVEYSYATGGVIASSSSGGLIGTATGGAINSSYWNSETSAQLTSAGGDALTMDQMKTESSFAGWDYVSTWAINEGSSYPYLQNNQQVPAPAPNPFEISSIQDLDGIRDFLHGHYTFTKNLDFNDDASYDPVSGWEAFKTSVTTGDGFEPIGVSASQFNGLLDGNGYSISNLYINRPGTDNVGLIGYANAAGEIRMLGLINVNVTGNSSTAALVGRSDGRLSECYSTGIVEGNQNTGGLVGYNYGWSASNIGEIINCYSQVYARGTSVRGGGLTGYSYYGIVENSYATGGVSASSSGGGLIGTATAGTVTNSYWNSETSAQVSSDGGDGLTIAQMKSASSFTGWDFADIWAINEGSSYPYLQNNMQVPAPGPNPFEVSSIQDLDNIRDLMHGHFILTKNLDFNDDGSYDPISGWEAFKTSVTTGDGYTPIGVSASQFNGLIDGNGYSISNLYINRAGIDNVGLVGVSNGAGEVRNIGVKDVNITGKRYVGAVVGYCFGTISGSYSSGIIEANQNAGGLTGINDGLAAANPGLIQNSYSTAYARTSSNYAGGLSSWNYYGEIINSYATGGVSASSSSGGLVGISTAGSTVNSFWNSETSAQVISAGGDGLTMAQMQSASSFSGWDFSNVWAINPGSSYPYLQNNQQLPAPAPNPFEVSSIQDLDNIRNFLHGHYILTRNLDFEDDGSYDNVSGWEAFKTSVTTGEGFSPIGVTASRFIGLLDGNGYAISNLYINRPTTDNIGLIGYSNGAGEVRNMGVIDTDITGRYYVGAIVGYCFGTIATSYSTGSIMANQNAGGLAGINDGLAATNPGLIINSYSLADVQASSVRAGGLSAWNYYAEIINSYATGAVSASSSSGGLVGTSSSATSTNSYWNMETAAVNTSEGGLASTTWDMKLQSTYTGWDFDNIWSIDEKTSYPYLKINVSSPLPVPAPIEIYTIQDLYSIRDYLIGHYILMNDLDFDDNNSYEQLGSWMDFKSDMTTGDGFEPIGTTSANEFRGFFDGNGFVIKNLYISRASTSNIGLFGYVGTAGRIARTGIVDADVTGGRYVGAFAGYSNGTILNCFSTGSITNTVTGDAGGIAGYNYGLGTSTGFISDCYSRASVTGLARVGGLVGWNYYATVINSYSTGAVTGTSATGGLVGQASVASAIDCFWDTQTSGQPSSAGGSGRTTAEMTYPYAANTFDTWNFIHLWAEDAAHSKNDGYPYFGFPSEYSSPNLVIEDGNSGCFDSEDKIILAGGGTHFLLESGASLDLAAVNSIIFKDGFRAMAGSYGHFFIDPSGTYCNPPSMLSVEEESFIEPLAEVIAKPSISVYPNPTSGSFTLDLIGFDEETPAITVEVLGNLGERIELIELNGLTSLQFDLNFRPAGIYFVRILNGNEITLKKIIKQ